MSYKSYSTCAQEDYENILTEGRGFGPPNWRSETQDTYFMMMIQLLSRDVEAEVAKIGETPFGLDLYKGWELFVKDKKRGSKITAAKDRLELYAAIEGIAMPELSDIVN